MSKTKNEYKPSRWFAWKPVEARYTTHDGILFYKWVLFEMIWRWKEPSYIVGVDDKWVYCTDNPAQYYRGRG
jgi:hypothetical protein